MSTNPKTHTLAPEQQAKLNHLVEREMDEAYYTGLYMKAKDARACLREFAVEVLEELGVPVVARDEANEFKGRAERAEAAIREWVEAERPYLDMGRQPTFQEHTRFSEAIIALRRLAGGESEK